MEEVTWAGLLRGVLASVAFLVLFFAARLRWRQRDPKQGAADLGLD